MPSDAPVARPQRQAAIEAAAKLQGGTVLKKQDRKTAEDAKRQQKTLDKVDTDKENKLNEPKQQAEAKAKPQPAPAAKPAVAKDGNDPAPADEDPPTRVSRGA